MKQKKAGNSTGGVFDVFKKILTLASFFTILFFLFGQQIVYATETIYIDNQAAASYKQKGGNQSTTVDSNIVHATATPTAPPIKVVKTVSAPVRVAGQEDTFDMVYTVKVRNESNVDATYVHLADNLNCTYRMYENPRPVKSWSLTQKPQIVDGPLVANDGYTGKSPCASDKVTAFDSTSSVQLVNGQVTLPAYGTATLTYSVRITLAPGLSREQRTFTNTVFAVILESSDSASAVSASSSAAIPIVPIDPSGVVYNSVTRTAVAGAITTLSRESCSGKTPGPITEAQIFNPFGIAYTYNADGTVSMTTDTKGFYAYFFKTADSCQYKLTVTPPGTGELTFPSKLIPVTPGNAPAGNVQPQPTPPAVGQDTTHYFNFLLNAKADVWNNHIPLDPKSSGGAIFLEKKGSKSVVELGDALLYTLTLSNRSGKTLTNVQVKDVLPRGFSFVSGSARLENKAVADPLGAPGANLQFNFNNLQWTDGQSLTLTYMVQVGVGASLQGSSVNVAQIFSGGLSSNLARWPVTVTGGVFSDEAYLIGKVYLEDCKADKVQNKPNDKTTEEIGIPGVRLLLEDGTSVVTDIEGKFSLYGLSPITHVLKLDKFTLPAGSRLIPLSNRNSGKGDSRFVDLKKGELHKADFAVDACKADSVVQEVLSRRKALEQNPISEGEALIKQKLEASYIDTPVSDPRARPASGIMTATGMQNTTSTATGSNANSVSTSNAATTGTAINNSNAAANPIANGAFQAVLPPNTTPSLAAQRLNENFPARPSVIALEEQVKTLDNKTGFIDLKDGDTLPTNITNVRVKGMLGATLQLKVNGVAESGRRVGKKSKIADKKLEAWEYIGVELKAGTNLLTLEVTDGFGNVRDSQTISVIAPGKMGRIEIDAPQTATADFKTPVKIKIRLEDDKGVAVTTRTQLTLETDQGRFENQDLNPTEPGVQVFMEGGSAEFTLIPPGEPKDGTIKVYAGNLQQITKISFLPELRPLVGAGIIEGVLDFTKAGKVNVNSPTAFDAFERELRNLSVSTHSMKATGRAAFYFKGTIKGEYLLTTAYDSDKDTKQRLFRDIQPEKFYPIYGDSSLKSFDAQSTQRFYLRVDKQKSYLMYGDFMTAENNEAQKLSQYSRSITGVKGHYENGAFSATAFASRDNLTQGILEIPANGTSGPYKLNLNGNTLYENSEKVEILVRDKNQPSIILETTLLTRFSDYAIDPIAGEIFFKGPVASIDANMNPRTIRVTYEVNKGGKEFWTAGADARLKVMENWEVGASYTRDENPQKKSQIAGINTTVKLGDNTTVIGEVARTDTGKDTTGLTGNSGIGYLNQYNPQTSGVGWAERLQIRHDGQDLKADAQVTHTSKKFNNPTAGVSSGRTEASANLTYKMTEETQLKGQAIYSKDSNVGGTRVGVLAVIEHAFNEMIRGEIGIRAAYETTNAAQPTSTGATPYELVALRAKLGSKLPWIEGADVYTEVEQDVLNLNRHMVAVGAGYLVNDKTRLYGRYQFISSISNSAYSINSSQQNNVAVVGVESAYSNDGRLFSEYRIRDAINGRESQAAVGLRQTWNLFDGFKLGGGFEMTHAFAGQSGNNSKAITVLAEYTTDPRYKVTGSAEARFASTGNSYLNTLGFAYKIDEDWSLLARNSFSLQQNRSDHSALWRTRQQIGVAWRQVQENRWNALARYEHRLEKKTGNIDPYSEDSHIFSTHVNYQPHKDVITSGRYAVKWSEQTRNAATSNFLGHLLYGRVTWDFWPDWDVSLQTGAMYDNRNALQYGHGLELGYQAINDLWLSAGYNFKGFDGGDLKGTNYTAQGFYVRMRFKFDEGLFE